MSCVELGCGSGRAEAAVSALGSPFDVTLSGLDFYLFPPSTDQACLDKLLAALDRTVSGADVVKVHVHDSFVVFVNQTSAYEQILL